jgi:cytochrome P450
VAAAMNGLNTPPGPRTPAPVQGLQMLRDPIGFILGMQRRYGDIFTVKMPGFGSVVFVASPELAQEVFRGDPSTYHAGDANGEIVEGVFGKHSILVLDEEEHLRARRVLLPAFHGEKVRAYTDVVREAAESHISAWPVGEPFALLPETESITLQVILRAIFGLRDPDRIARGRELMEEFAQRSHWVGLFTFTRHDFGPFSPLARFHRTREALWEFIREEIAERAADESIEERDDVLSALLQARHEDGSAMEWEEIRDELVTMIAAGFHTTAISIAWVFDCLLHDRRVLDRLRDSLAEGSDEYLDATIKEALRLHPVLSEVGRKVTRDVELGGYDVAAGTVVLPSIAAVQRRADVYPHPDRFRPERFLDGEVEQYAWIPFGGGTRRCPGAAFAQHEMRIVIRMILERTELRAADDRPDRVKLRGVTRPPARGTQVVLRSAPYSPASQTPPRSRVTDSKVRQ